MRGAIGFALNWPERRPLPVDAARLRRARRGSTSAPPTRSASRRCGWRARCCELGGLAGAVFNAAKEAALDAYLLRAIGFLDMAVLVEHVLERLGPEAAGAGRRATISTR